MNAAEAEEAGRVSTLGLLAMARLVYWPKIKTIKLIGNGLSVHNFLMAMTNIAP